MRGFMRAPPGHALIYLDYEAEEFAIKMAQSGDQAGIRAYLSGDPYVQTGILMGLAPPGATKYSHAPVRALCKVLTLALGYGMTVYGLSRRLGLEESAAAELMAKYDAAYPVARAWSDAMTAHARTHGRIITPYGWQMRVPRNINPRTILNWPVQSLGADLLRLVAMALVADGLKVLGLIHDAVLLEARTLDVAAVVQRAVAIMERASEQVVGLRLRVDVGSEEEPHIFPHPARFRDKREGRMYDKAVRLLKAADRIAIAS
jgi:DNA polymerase I-like protein with 3'-5' exonuclease and polymerase domains